MAEELVEGLKPCPFCGGDALVHRDSYGRGLWTVSCKMHLECYAIEKYYQTREEAISAWNTRVSNLEPIRSCPFCGGKAKVYRVVNSVWKVSCKKVDCAFLCSDWKTPEEAIAAWNRRNISEEELQAALKAFQRKRCVDVRD